MGFSHKGGAMKNEAAIGYDHDSEYHNIKAIRSLYELRR
jgi:hypothetical protein